MGKQKMGDRTNNRTVLATACKLLSLSLSLSLSLIAKSFRKIVDKDAAACNEQYFDIQLRKDNVWRHNRRCLRAGRLLTSTAGAVTPLIVMLALVGIVSIGVGNGNTYAADSISLSIDTNTISLDLAPRTATGEFKESSSANISASTTSSSGYTLSIASSTNSTDLTNTTDHTSKITSIESNLTTSDFSNASNTQYNNKWGYKPSQYVTINGDTHTTHTNTGANAVFKPLPGQAGEILAITEQANQQNSPDTYTISMGARVNNTIPTGSYQSNAFVIMAVANKSTTDCDNTKLCVQYDGNGLTFPETEAQLARSVNNVNYNSVSTPQTRYSHTSNINDAGVASGTYPASQATKDVVTIPGASELNVTIYYATGKHGSYGHDATAYAFTGEYTGTISYDTTGYLKKYQSGTGTTKETANTESFTVTGDTVTFGFYSASSSSIDCPAYGYYAVITVPANRVLTSGEYAIPTGNNAIFHGWSSTATTPGAGLPSDVEYADETAVKNWLPGDNTEAKTLYAVWQQGYPITFTMDSNTSSIAVVDVNGITVDTITASGQSLTLYQGDTYALKPTYAPHYAINSITKTTGAGTLTVKGLNADFQVGAGSATVNITSKAVSPMQNYSCSTLASVGSTAYVYDNRDNQLYLIGKLADNKCWMLDNLALDLTNDTILNALTADNTNINTSTDPGALAALKGTTPGTTSDKYATTKVANWTSSYSYSAPLVNLTNKDVISQGSDPMASTVLAGEWKVGGYYNYCAASAGSYCYGNGTSQGTSSGNATSSICPKGWRMPTGSTGETTALYNAYSSGSPNQYTAFRTAFHLPLSGYFNNGSAGYQGSNGYWWSSTRYNKNYSMCYLSAYTSSIYPRDSTFRYLGYSLRCILDS